MELTSRLGSLPTRLGAALLLGGGLVAGVAGLSGHAAAFPIAATEGDFMAFLSTHSAGDEQIENPELPSPAGAPFDDIDDLDLSDVATMSINFSFSLDNNTNQAGAAANSVGGTYLRFDMAVLTGEKAPPLASGRLGAPDPFAVDLNGQRINFDNFFNQVSGAIGDVNGDLDEFNGPFFDAAIIGPDVLGEDSVGSVFFNGHTLGDAPNNLPTLTTFEIDIEPGVHTLTFAVADFGDNIIDTGLLVDNIRLVTPSLETVLTGAASIGIEVIDLVQGFEGDIILDDGSVVAGLTASAIDVVTSDIIPVSGNVSIVTGPQFQQAAAAVPEPATMSLMAAGLLGFGAAAFRRRRKQTTAIATPAMISARIRPARMDEIPQPANDNKPTTSWFSLINRRNTEHFAHYLIDRLSRTARVGDLFAPVTASPGVGPPRPSPPYAYAGYEGG